MKLTLFNSFSRQTENFIPLNTKLIKMYVCGPTVYDRPHIGNARSVVVYDILYRILNHLYGSDNVRYVRNITDIDDKIIDKARKDDVSIQSLTKKTTEYFHHDMEYLGCLRPNIEPKATEHLDDMILIIQKLLDKDIAYISNEHVYFDVSKAHKYHKLSGRSFDDARDSVRIQPTEGKRNSGDFVLWKPCNDSDPESAKYNSPFGIGRPGWHIECSAMSYRFLGETFDIHGGGADLIFPHHTNEIAQSCCAFEGSEYAKTWVHNGFLTVNSEKMSKSLGNFITVQDLIEKNIPGDVIRLFLLSNNYRKPLDYNEKAIKDAQHTLDYWYRAINSLGLEMSNDISRIPTDFMEALCDDMNVNKAIVIMNNHAKKIFKNQDSESAEILLSCAKFLGLMNKTSNEWFSADIDSDYVENLINQRNNAKKVKDWQKADSIRNELLEKNIEIEDLRDGTTKWRKIRH